MKNDRLASSSGSQADYGKYVSLKSYASDKSNNRASSTALGLATCATVFIWERKSDIATVKLEKPADLSHSLTPVRVSKMRLPEAAIGSKPGAFSHLAEIS